MKDRFQIGEFAAWPITQNGDECTEEDADKAGYGIYKAGTPVEVVGTVNEQHYAHRIVRALAADSEG